MRRDELEMYLDGELDAERRAAVEQAVAADAETRQMLERVRGERALRVQALAGYTPPPAEAAAFGAKLMAEMRAAGDAPLARIGMQVWVRRVSGIAAALLLAAGTYWMGRVQTSAVPTDTSVAGTQQTTQTTQTTLASNQTPATAVRTRYIVVVPSSSGVTSQTEFDTQAEAQAYAQQVQADQETSQVASAYTQGVF